MTRFVYTDGMRLAFLLLQIYFLGQPSGVSCLAIRHLGSSIKREIQIHTVRSASCCDADNCNTICCPYNEGCHHRTKRDILEVESPNQKRSASSNTKTKTKRASKREAPQCSNYHTNVGYDANNKNQLRLWSDRAPGAVGDNPCTDIPFLVVFQPTGTVSRTDVAIVVFPGGGYDRLTDHNEQTPVAKYFADKLGITTFILHYRLVQDNGTYRYPVPMWDGQRALRYVRHNAAQYNINPKHVGIFGFSAGGHLASTIALHSAQNFNLTTEDAIDTTNARPNFLGLGYPVISMDPQQHAANASLGHLLQGYTGSERKRLENYLSGQKHVTKNTPPTFLFESVDDKKISSQNSVLFVKALENAGRSYEAHLFQQGTHGAGLAHNQLAEKTWPKLFHTWLIETNFLS